jgi:hypothetical protein
MNPLLLNTVLLGCVFLFVGCSAAPEKTYPVQGRVTYTDGQPVTAGSVELQGTAKGKSVNATGEIQADGSFQLTTFQPRDGAIAGDHAITLHEKPFEGLGENPIPPPPQIAPKYSSYGTSPLKCTIDAAKQNAIELKIDRPK